VGEVHVPSAASATPAESAIEAAQIKGRCQCAREWKETAGREIEGEVFMWV
jgi:hypothetical protein